MKLTLLLLLCCLSQVFGDIFITPQVPVISGSNVFISFTFSTNAPTATADTTWFGLYLTSAAANSNSYFWYYYAPVGVASGSSMATVKTGSQVAGSARLNPTSDMCTAVASTLGSDHTPLRGVVSLTSVKGVAPPSASALSTSFKQKLSLRVHRRSLNAGPPRIAFFRRTNRIMRMHRKQLRRLQHDIQLAKDTERRLQQRLRSIHRAVKVLTVKMLRERRNSKPLASARSKSLLEPLASSSEHHRTRAYSNKIASLVARVPALNQELRAVRSMRTSKLTNAMSNTLSMMERLKPRVDPIAYEDEPSSQSSSTDSSLQAATKLSNQVEEQLSKFENAIAASPKEDARYAVSELNKLRQVHYNLNQKLSKLKRSA